MTPLITPHALYRILGARDLVLFDSTVLLPGESFDPEADFLHAHIPGARRFDVERFSDPEGTLPHMVPSQARFARLAGEAGIDNDSHVVLYDKAGLVGAARAWWLLGLFGHDRVQVLDGGLAAWRAESLPLEQSEAAPAPARTFRPRLRAERLVGLGDMIAIAAGERTAVVIDARSRARFDGRAPEPRPGLPGGHIPGSASLPFTDLQDADKRLLPPEALRARFNEAGIDGSLDVVTSCGSGLTASVLSLGLCVAGLPPGAMFDGSWTEWASHPELPRETSS
ncbi:sulfurtransferase [Lichenicoccus sp.]|uniref:sulfurtransferase n=1 Tax=Lichenicoccus sp. TaxID=2781899 RepID=UPI003D0DB90C